MRSIAEKSMRSITEKSMRERHLSIGLAAVTEGFLTPESFSRAMRELAESGHDVPPRELWVRPGRLTTGQLDELERRLAERDAPLGTGAPDAALRRTDVDIGRPAEGARNTERGWPLHPQPSPTRYHRNRVLAEGGVGTILECVDEELCRRVAVKLLRADAAADADAAALLAHEARVTGSLEHPNIIPVYDMGADADGHPYYVMRLVEQPTLADAIQLLREGDPRATADYGLGRLLRDFAQVCRAVDYAHSRGLLHCDLKPANVLLGSFGEVLVADWGLASAINQGMSFRGGTIGYMGPEQVLASTRRETALDRRADVFALGAILYEILTLQPALPDMSLRTVLSAAQRGPGAWPVPIPPAERAPDRAIPPELAEVALKAMQPRPEDRYATSRELATAVESFLEGTRERARRLARAEEQVAQAALLAQAYDELIHGLPDTIEELAEIRSRVAVWEIAAKKQELWDAEDRVAVMEALSIRTFQAAAATYEQALDEVPGFAPARRGLARIYRGELRRAQDRRDRFAALYFKELVRQYDDTGDMQAPDHGVAGVTTTPPVDAVVAALHEEGRRLIAGPERALGRTPIERAVLSAGSHILTLDGRVRVPLHVRVGSNLSVAVDMREAGDLRSGEILVPGGPALIEGGRGLVEVDVPSFVIAELPVSFGEYLEFLTERQLADPEAAEALWPRMVDGPPLWRWHEGAFEPAAADRWGPRGELVQFPVFGVDVASAEAYIAWIGRRTGLPYRIPTEIEWEKAARGTDGRRYPWGDHFDASFCKMRESRPGPPFPERRGAFEADVSPYGVRDLAGGAADWVTPATPQEAGLLCTRGGAWTDHTEACRISSRRTYLAVERSLRVGFRLARSLTPAVAWRL